MSITLVSFDLLQRSDASGHHILRVPHSRAADLSTHLERYGIHSTACPKSGDMTTLEIWRGPSAEQVRQALVTWQA